MADIKLKVTFVDMKVTRDGDPIGRGEIYWSLKVDGQVVADRSSGNPYTIGSGGTITIGESRTVTKSGAVGTKLVVSGTVSERDSGPSGKDESDFKDRSHNAGDDWGTTGPQKLQFFDNNLDVTLNYIIERF